MKFSMAVLLTAFGSAAFSSSTGDRSRKHYENGQVFTFDQVYEANATPDQVRNGTMPVTGQPGATGYFKFGLNNAEETIRYNITLLDVSGNYQSPAHTATHIHEAARGASGPPRIAFHYSIGIDHRRVSVDCLTGPFVTGINATDGTDTGTRFTVAKLAANPEAFFAGTHTSAFLLGAVRGQLEEC